MNDPVTRLFVLSFLLCTAGALSAVILELHGWCAAFSLALTLTTILMPERRHERA